MRDATVSTALVAVRRHLWRDDARVALRRAAWICAAAALLVALVHLLARPVPVVVLAVALGLVFSAMLAWTAAHRRSVSDCAWWIDRHLGGASAFTTWLDAMTRRPSADNARAVAWTERWVAAKVPDVLRSLAGQRASARLAPSMLTMVVCTLLAAVVLMLPQETSSPRQMASEGATPLPGDPLATAVDAPIVAQVASEIAGALRSTDAPRVPDRSGSGGAPGPGGAGATDDGDRSADARPANGGSGDEGASRDAASASGAPADGPAGQGRSAAGAATGRLAGESRDARGDVGSAPVPGGTIPARLVGSTSRPGARDRQADMAQQADFDDTLARPGRPMTNAMPTAAAATPPPATDSARLSPGETGYVQAWLKATGSGR